MHPRQVVRPQLIGSRLSFAPGSSTTIRAPTQPVRKTIIIRAPPPPQPIIIRAPPIRPTIIIHAPTQTAPRPSIIPPPPQHQVQSLIPITPPTAQPAAIKPPPQAIIIRAPPASPPPADEPITFKLKWANGSVHGVVQDFMFEPRRSPTRDLLKFILAMEQVVRERQTAALLELHGLSFWVALQLTYAHPTKEIVDMKHQYLNSGKLILTHMASQRANRSHVRARP